MLQRHIVVAAAACVEKEKLKKQQKKTQEAEECAHVETGGKRARGRRTGARALVGAPAHMHCAKRWATSVLNTGSRKPRMHAAHRRHGGWHRRRGGRRCRGSGNNGNNDSGSVGCNGTANGGLAEIYMAVPDWACAVSKAFRRWRCPLHVPEMQ